ncbi:MAG: UDP-N-acetylmuramoyl-L-alanyl-D-glutamate--2,6-diaminopimelate ligase [Oscillospiraceae bacterium]|jgi:UDP-N-acetylmuramoyl-L-alanyl-D-glutamate--2,6-diaminopimelate ligase|nr:UDP-N-acetylmuramoyl-L-alanyl-D-glutamate--2,6-diaminopimelate ligase [Oscillospiraceae bacterium]
MKLQELLKNIQVLESTADGAMEISGLCYDSRRVRPGDVFVALRGYSSDGHKFIDAAAQLGAAAVICQEKPEGSIPYVLVADSRLALALASCEFFGNPADEMKLVGVTGTNGKTTTTMLLKHVIESVTGQMVGLIGTNQNMIGSRVLETEHTTPESYELQRLFREMADSGCKYVVMEVSSHALTLSRVGGVSFEAGVFTNLTQDHLDFHGSMEEYAKAKARLFGQCKALAVNLDDDWSGFMLEKAQCPVFTFSEKHSEADLIARDIRFSPEEVRFVALIGEGSIERIRLGIPGRFSVYNALAVIAAAHLLGLKLDETAAALREAKGVKGRVEVVPGTMGFTILIDYAHTPDALENVIRSIKEVSPGRVVVLFGCGGDRDRAKRPIMGEIGVRLADFAIITSDNPRTEVPAEIIAEIVSGVKEPKSKFTVIEDRERAIAWAIENQRPDDVIILAGKGHETYQIVGTEKRHMDEREIVAKVLAELKTD